MLEVIKEIRALDLENIGIVELEAKIRSVGRVGIVGYNLLTGSSILRARPEDEYVEYKHISELSYKPQEYNVQFQRASTPNRTMFYGCPFVTELYGERDDDAALPRVTAMMEALENARPLNSRGV